MKVFYAIGKISTVFVCDDSTQQNKLAEEALYKEFNSNCAEIDSMTITEIKTQHEIPKGWLGSIPWFTKDDKRVEQILQERDREGEVIDISGVKYKLTKVQ